ncbi:MAG: hypothetical protein IJG06_01260, partial [Clostridia bacterium]|nr:hypothetical protein [Clostridia bacterium]
MNLKNKLISVVLSMTMLISVFPFSVITASALTESDIITMDDITDTDTPPVISDDGKDWYEIRTLRQLMWFPKQVNSGNS